MEDLLGFVFVMIAVISALSNAAAKKKAQNKQQASFPQAASAAAPKPAAARPAPPAPKQFSMASMLPPREAPAPRAMKPQVHTHLNPDCETHDIPGSLGVTSMEGKDACHEGQLSGMRTIAAAPQEARPGLALDWTSDALVKAVVMQEVLTRPCQRQARR